MSNFIGPVQISRTRIVKYKLQGHLKYLQKSYGENEYPYKIRHKHTWSFDRGYIGAKSS